jgi:hypothetical protein
MNNETSPVGTCQIRIPYGDAFNVNQRDASGVATLQRIFTIVVNRISVAPIEKSKGMSSFVTWAFILLTSLALYSDRFQSYMLSNDTSRPKFNTHCLTNNIANNQP